MPTRPRFGLDGTTSPDEQYARDLDRAAGFKPITQQDLKVAYSQYDQKPGQVKASDTDQQLYKKATNTVIAWWKKQKSAEAARKAESDAAKQAAAQAQAQQQARAASAARSGSGGGGTSGSGGQLLPDTAYDPNKVVNNPKLKPIPAPITPDYVTQQLKRNGFAGSKPPAYALRNKETFHAWLNRAIRYRDQHSGKAVAVRSPVTGKTVVTTKKPVATNRNPVIR